MNSEYTLGCESALRPDPEHSNSGAVNRSACFLSAISGDILQAVNPLTWVTRMCHNHDRLDNFRKRCFRSHDEYTWRMASGLKMGDPMCGHRTLVIGHENAPDCSAHARISGSGVCRGRSGRSPTRTTSIMSMPRRLCDLIALHKGPRQFSSSTKPIDIGQFFSLERALFP